MARNDSYEDLIESHLDEIEQWLEQNNTDKEIANKLGIAYSTFRKYKGISVALKGRYATVKDNKNQEVEKALYKGCVGYAYYEEIANKVKEEYLAEDGKTILSREVVKVVSVKKYKGPDLNAQKYWLNNKEKTKWKEDPHKVSNDKKLTNLKEKEINSRVIDI